MFRNREEAAFRLAWKLRGRVLHDPLVLAVPNGGIVIGAILARELGAPLDLILARKLRAPLQPELAMGAVTEDGQVYLTENAQDLPGLTRAYLAQERLFQLDSVMRSRRLFRAVRPPVSIRNRSVILTDDGIATGATMMAALQVIRALDPCEVIVAVPVVAWGHLTKIDPWCDEVVRLLSPVHLEAVSRYYRDFGQIDDDQVISLLRASNRNLSNDLEQDCEEKAPAGAL